MPIRKQADVRSGMTGDFQQSQASSIGRVWLLALILICVAGRAMFLALPVNSDTAMFVYAGKLVTEGGRPGVDLLDNKLPSVGLLMSAPWQAFRANWTGYAGLGLCLSLLSTVFLYRVARDLWDQQTAKVVAVASAIWLNFPPAVYGQLQLETIQVALASVSAACVLRTLRTGDARDAFAAGLTASLATWAKPTGGAVITAAITVFIVSTFNGKRRQAAKQIASTLLGCVVPAGVLLLIVFKAGYAESLPATLKQLRDYSSQSTLNAMDLAKPVMVLGLLGFPVLILAWLFRRDGKRETVTNIERLFVLLWFLAELAGVISQRRMYAYHFLVLGPPAAVLTGMLARRVSAMSLTMAFGPAVAISAWLTMSTLVALPGESRDDRVIDFVRDHATADQSVWMDDYPRLLVETDRRAGASVPLIFLMANSDAAPEFFGKRLLGDFAAKRPGLVVFAAEPGKVADLYRYHMAEVAASSARADALKQQLLAIESYLQRHYRPDTDIGNVRVWRRNDGATGVSIAAGQ